MESLIRKLHFIETHGQTHNIPVLTCSLNSLNLYRLPEMDFLLNDDGIDKYGGNKHQRQFILLVPSSSLALSMFFSLIE